MTSLPLADKYSCQACLKYLVIISLKTPKYYNLPYFTEETIKV